MESDIFIVKFDGASSKDASIFAESLRLEILDADPSIEAETKRDSKSTMDFGASLVLVLGTPAAVIAAKAILKWAGRNNDAKLQFFTPDGTLVVDHLESKDAAAVVKAFASVRSKGAT
jgi:hypothetical protein